MNICATVSRDLPADPDALFETLVNPHRLPEWNKAITTVIDGPETLAPGDEWVVEMAALAQRWQTRSQVKVLNCSTRRFEYTSQSDGGDPSYALWSCESPGVSWRLHQTRGDSWRQSPEPGWMSSSELKRRHSRE